MDVTVSTDGTFLWPLTSAEWGSCRFSQPSCAGVTLLGPLWKGRARGCALGSLGAAAVPCYYRHSNQDKENAIIVMWFVFYYSAYS